MIAYTGNWTFRAVLTGLLALLLALPQTLEAQRAVRRGGDGSGQTSAGAGQSSGGGGGQRPAGRDAGQDRGSRAPRGGGAERRAAPPDPARPTPKPAAPRSDTSATVPADAEGSTDDNAAGSARRRGDNQQTGTAVARRPVRPRPGDGGRIIVPGGWYPWGWGGYGFAGYYGFYDPWWYGGYGYGGQYYPRRDDGSVRLKVKPRDASVYVDGYYAGRVDDFDGIFQALPLEPGPHRIEMQLEGYTALTFDVRVLPDRKITFEGEMKPVAP
jgi:hypothetical protein